jgi:hypothetical protein
MTVHSQDLDNCQLIFLSIQPFGLTLHRYHGGSGRPSAMFGNRADRNASVYLRLKCDPVEPFSYSGYRTFRLLSATGWCCHCWHGSLQFACAERANCVAPVLAKKSEDGCGDESLFKMAADGSKDCCNRLQGYVVADFEAKIDAVLTHISRSVTAQRSQTRPGAS